MHNFGIAPNDTSVMGGCILFGIPYDSKRQEIIETVALTKKQHAGTQLLYAQWID
jgi:hypothetical protein